jgi:hypothetical protein
VDDVPPKGGYNELIEVDCKASSHERANANAKERHQPALHAAIPDYRAELPGQPSFACAILRVLFLRRLAVGSPACTPKGLEDSMNRIVTRFGLLLLYGVIAGGTVSACASEVPPPFSGTGGASGAAGASGASGSGATGDKPMCKPEFCPMHAGAMQCCATAYDCGLNWGTGCMANSAGKKDGG